MSEYSNIPEEFRRIVEIEGVKVEIDLRQAKKVDTFRVGSPVKLLKKQYSGYESLPGVIVGFDDFEKLPTIVVAYVGGSYADPKVQFAYINSESKDYELAAMHESDLLPTRETVIGQLDSAIARAQAELDKAVEHRRYFLQQFGAAFSRYMDKEAAQ